MRIKWLSGFAFSDSRKGKWKIWNLLDRISLCVPGIEQWWDSTEDVMLVLGRWYYDSLRTEACGYPRFAGVVLLMLVRWREMFGEFEVMYFEHPANGSWLRWSVNRQTLKHVLLNQNFSHIGWFSHIYLVERFPGIMNIVCNNLYGKFSVN